ncbi:calcium-binding protein [Rhizobium sp. G187]|uniref:calcium-binding protein n=1 Tax=Rhizobium sp. G187 TaxID=3451352 RepID=UPI003EE78444
MNGKTLTLTAVAASLLLGTAASGAYAQGHGDRRGPGRGGPEVRFVQMLQMADTNKDGKIAKDEARTAGEALFVSIDADKDGTLTPGEMRQHHEKMRAEMQAARAAAKANAPDDETAVGPGEDGPGPGDMAEGPGGGRHDGKHHEGKRHGWHGERADRGERGEGRDRGPGGMGGPGRMIRVADTDENGQISKAEATAMADKMFERMDTNKDGSISADDMPKRPMMFR